MLTTRPGAVAPAGRRYRPGKVSGATMMPAGERDVSAARNRRRRIGEHATARGERPPGGVHCGERGQPFCCLSRRRPARLPGELRHPGIAEVVARRLEVVGPATDLDVLDGRRPAERAGSPMVELELVRRAADAPRRERRLAAALVARPDLPLHVRRDAIRVAGARRREGPVGEPLPLRGLVEELVERRLEHLGVARARVHVGERGARGFELLEQARRDGDVIARQVLRERLDLRAPGRRRERRSGGWRLDYNWLSSSITSLSSLPAHLQQE